MGSIRGMMLAASLAAVAVAAPACGGPAPTSTVSATSVTSTGAPTPTLPISGGATNLPSPPTNSTLLYVAVGHGIQNYTCANTTANATSNGALAVLYDITAFYPGTPNTGLSADGFASITTTVLYTQDMPINLANTSAETAVGTSSEDASTGLPETAYAAKVANPFPGAPGALTLGSAMPTAPWLGFHYFDASSTATFDLQNSPKHEFFSGTRASGVKAPATSSKGLLQTGAVDWLQLADSGKGLSKGVRFVYRVVTEGGAAEACSASGAGPGSVPYTAQYWFFG